MCMLKDTFRVQGPLGKMHIFTVGKMEFRTFHIFMIPDPILQEISGLRFSKCGHHCDNVKTHHKNDNQ